MEVSLNLDQATYHVENTTPLKLKELSFKIKSNIKEEKKLFRKPSYKLTIIAEVNDRIYEFAGYDLNQELISQLEKDPSRFLVGAESPFLCGTNWPDSGISEVIESNNVPLGSLIIIDGKNVVATIPNDEIAMLIHWLKDLVH